MASTTGNNHKIKDTSPYNGTHKVDVHLTMYYTIAEGYYIFLYKGARITEQEGLAKASPPFVETENELGRAKIEIDPDGSVRIVQKYFEDLDIGIRQGDERVRVTVETIDNGIFKDMYWYQDPGVNPAIEAVMTAQDRKLHYGDLLYSDDGVNWFKTIPSQSCRFIQFKAKEKSGAREDHKFSYNVRLPGFPDFFEIDPEIQNPKV